MSQMEQNSTHWPRQWFMYIGFGCFLLFCSFGYVQAELTTILYQKQLENPVEICHQQDSSRLKYIKILRYEKFRREAQLECVYDDSTKNLILLLNYTTKWEPVLIKKVNREGGLVWPIYL